MQNKKEKEKKNPTEKCRSPLLVEFQSVMEIPSDSGFIVAFGAHLHLVVICINAAFITSLMTEMQSHPVTTLNSVYDDDMVYHLALLPQMNHYDRDRCVMTATEKVLGIHSISLFLYSGA